MPTPAKIAEVAELTDKIHRSRAIVLMHYRELKMKELTELRNKLYAHGKTEEGNAAIELRVSKNTLFRIAANNAGKADSEDLFTGPTAAAFIYGDEAKGAKTVADAVRALRKDNVKVTGGFVGTQKLSADAVERLATLEPRDVQLAKLLGAMQASAGQLAATLSGAAQELVYTLMAYQEKLEKQG